MSKGLESLKDFKEHYFFEYDEEENLNAIEKELKALEIIKSMNFIRVYETLGGNFVLETVDDGIKMTKENYDLLKEIFIF